MRKLKIFVPDSGSHKLGYEYSNESWGILICPLTKSECLADECAWFRLNDLLADKPIKVFCGEKLIGEILE